MKFKYYVFGTDLKARVSTCPDYKYVLMCKNGKGIYKVHSCHKSLELASKRQSHLILDYFRHPFDFCDWYKPISDDFFKICELEIRNF